MSYNKTILVGRLTATPELKHTQNNIAVTSFTLAVDNGYGDKKTTDFIRCVAWRNTAEFICKYFTKGQEMLIDGRITSRTYEKDNQKYSTTEVLANDVTFVGSKSSASNTNNEQENNIEIQNNDFSEVSSNDWADDLPF